MCFKLQYSIRLKKFRNDRGIPSSLERISTRGPQRSLVTVDYKKCWKNPLNKVSFPKPLHMCGISPYTTESVERYMEQAAKRVNGSAFRRFFKLTRDDVTSLFLIVLASFVLAAIASIAGNSSGLISKELALVNTGGVIACTGAILLALCFLPNGRTVFMWRTDAIGHYTLPIPDFALHKALSLKKECPEVSFTIHSLVKEEVVRDPILSASYDGERYYLAVWGEPSFIGEREDEVKPVT